MSEDQIAHKAELENLLRNAQSDLKVITEEYQKICSPYKSRLQKLNELINSYQEQITLLKLNAKDEFTEWIKPMLGKYHQTTNPNFYIRFNSAKKYSKYHDGNTIIDNEIGITQQYFDKKPNYLTYYVNSFLYKIHVNYNDKETKLLDKDYVNTHILDTTPDNKNYQKDYVTPLSIEQLKNIISKEFIDDLNTPIFKGKLNNYQGRNSVYFSDKKTFIYDINFNIRNGSFTISRLELIADEYVKDSFEIKNGNMTMPKFLKNQYGVLEDIKLQCIDVATCMYNYIDKKIITDNSYNSEMPFDIINHIPIVKEVI